MEAGQKRLVVCFDGTWNSADDSGAEATNVERIARAVRGSSGDKQQIVLYLRGVGTTGTQSQKLLGGALGLGVGDNIRAAYQFLAQNYMPARGSADKPIPADEIYIFGFSRGAYTARSLAGFIGIAGLLKRQSLSFLEKAWEYYRDPNRTNSRDFCEMSGADCHHQPEIKFLAVWDTVGRLGIPKTVLGFQIDQNHTFHNTEPSSIVKNGFHALAVDEKRDEFVPTLWTGPHEPEGCQIDQVWFPGVHSDVGGGYAERHLADLPLFWMAERAQACGLDLDWDEVVQLLPRKIDLDPLAAQHESRFSFSRKDRWTPTYRRVCGADFETSFLERIDFPMNEETGEPLSPIRESLHPSLLERWDRTVAVYYDEEESTLEEELYRPKNLVGLKVGEQPMPVYTPRVPV